MFRLIAREIYDHIVYIGACWVLGGIMVSIMIYTFVNGFPSGGFLFSGVLIVFVFLGLCLLGIAQMYGDRANRISVLLSTQAVTRNHILAARVLVGAVALLTSLVPVLVTGVILLGWKFPPLDFYSHVIRDVSAALLLTGFACYCIGLMIGWTNSKARLIVGSFLSMVLAISVLAIKGFGLSAAALLFLLIAAILTRVWHTFTSASL